MPAATGAEAVVAAVGDLLAQAGLPRWPARLAATALGADAADALTGDPWLLLDVAGVTPTDADRFALAVADPRPARDDPRRGRAYTGYVIARAGRDGHTLVPTDTVLRTVAGLGYPDPDRALAAALDDGRVVRRGDDLLALTRYAAAEASVAEGLRRLSGAAKPLRETGSAADGLDDAQRAAVGTAARHGVSLLTGGPGTGKSRTVAAVVALGRADRRRLALAAPTGRAAKRLEELADEPATTLHRLLGAQGTTGEFARGAGWPLDADLVVVDETSMLDAELAAALVEACADGTHLLLVGDPAQLPSIGAGRVLGDVLDSGAFPVTELTTLHRHAVGGAIARLATAVRGGQLPPVDPPGPAPEVAVLAADGSDAAARRVVQLVTESIPRALGIGVDEVQVTTPVHRGPAGTIALNTALKQVLNPGPGLVGGFDPGDRVVAIANHLDLGFANGEVGVVTGALRAAGAAEGSGGLKVSFGSGPVTVPARHLADLRHGWAVTVHRAQGSEWPAVVAVLPPESGGLLSRPLVYTAFTRAQRHLSVVHACGPALVHAVRTVGARPRRTGLGPLLRDAPR